MQVEWQEKYKQAVSTMEVFTKWLDSLTIETLDIEEVADVAYVIREVEALLDATCKALRRTQKAAETIGCMQWVKNQNSDPIRTEYCTASPNLKPGVRIPKKGSPEEFELKLELGVPKEICSLVRISYEGLQNYVQKRESEGLPPPKGLAAGAEFNDFRLNIRKKKGITE